MGEHHVGVLLLCNFGNRDYLHVPGLEIRSGPAQARIARVVHRGVRALRPLLGLARVRSRCRGGHFLQEEAPDEVGELLAEFFAPA